MKGVGKINASSPRHIGEFEFHDPTAATEYMAMPKRLSNVVKKILALLTEEKRTSSKWTRNERQEG